MKISIHADGIVFNDTLIAHPLKFSAIENVLGEPTKIDNPNSNYLTYAWNNIGVRAFVDDTSDLVTQFDVFFVTSANAKSITTDV